MQSQYYEAWIWFYGVRVHYHPVYLLSCILQCDITCDYIVDCSYESSDAGRLTALAGSHRYFFSLVHSTSVFFSILFGDKNLIIHANTTSQQEKFGSGLDMKIFLHNSSVSYLCF